MKGKPFKWKTDKPMDDGYNYCELNYSDCNKKGCSNCFITLVELYTEDVETIIIVKPPSQYRKYNLDATIERKFKCDKCGTEFAEKGECPVCDGVVREFLKIWDLDDRVSFEKIVSSRDRVPAFRSSHYDSDSGYYIEIESYLWRGETYVSVWRTKYNEAGKNTERKHIYTSKTLLEDASCNSKEACRIKKEWRDKNK